MWESNEESTGHILRKFRRLRYGNMVLKRLWCPSCYRYHPDGIFRVNKPVGEAGFKCTYENDSGRFLLARPGGFHINHYAMLHVYITISNRKK